MQGGRSASSNNIHSTTESTRGLRQKPGGGEVLPFGLALGLSPQFFCICHCFPSAHPLVLAGRTNTQFALVFISM